LVVYHGSLAESRFSIFSPNKGKKRAFTNNTTHSFFSSNKSIGEEYARYRKEGLYEVFLNIKDPIIQDYKGADYTGELKKKSIVYDTTKGFKELGVFDTYDEATQYIKDNNISNYYIANSKYVTNDTNYFLDLLNNSEKNDGAILLNIDDSNSETVANDYITSKPNQIKSATDNVGTFST